MNANTPPGQRRPMPRTGRVLEAREVVVTAMAATTSLAGTLDDTWTSLLAGKSGIGHLDAEFLAQHDLPVRIGGRLKVDPGTLLERVERRRMSFGEQLAATLGRRVWSDAGSPSVDPNRLAVSIGTGLGSGTGHHTSYRGRRVEPPGCAARQCSRDIDRHRRPVRSMRNRQCTRRSRGRLRTQVGAGSLGRCSRRDRHELLPSQILAKIRKYLLSDRCTVRSWEGSKYIQR